MKIMINIHAVFHSYKLDNHEKKHKILFKKMRVILCKEHLVTMKFC